MENGMTHALVIVAHPDDETIWMGGTILRNPSWQWTILSLCRRSDPDRSPKFRSVCSHYNAVSLIADIEDEELRPLSPGKIQKTILKALPRKAYDYVFTHGKNGEYGHIRHQEAHAAVQELVQNNMLACRKLYYFSYVPGARPAPHDPETALPVPGPGEMRTRLNEKEHAEKVRLITVFYGFQDGSFEALSCNKEEAFVSGP